MGCACQLLYGVFNTGADCQKWKPYNIGGTQPCILSCTLVNTLHLHVQHNWAKFCSIHIRVLLQVITKRFGQKDKNKVEKKAETLSLAYGQPTTYGKPLLSIQLHFTIIMLSSLLFWTQFLMTKPENNQVHKQLFLPQCSSPQIKQHPKHVEIQLDLNHPVLTIQPGTLSS